MPLPLDNDTKLIRIESHLWEYMITTPQTCK
jgi:hypothetical protein